MVKSLTAVVTVKNSDMCYHKMFAYDVAKRDLTGMGNSLLALIHCILKDINDVNNQGSGVFSPQHVHHFGLD